MGHPAPGWVPPLASRPPSGWNHSSSEAIIPARHSEPNGEESLYFAGSAKNASGNILQTHLSGFAAKMGHPVWLGWDC
jgi:hypothetical protein